ncbi:MAG TPA: type III pantothenate kinase [Candidatus Krumholzibacteria bacterium]|nr:type III pantothenate kinase [Candidatus Krumholzibacteria bacterium]
MILCVDIGNTAAKLGIVRGATVSSHVVIPANAGARAVDHALLRALRGVRNVDGAAVCSVRPAATDELVRAVMRRTGYHPIVVNDRTPMPIRLAVRHPERVGTDRLCAACGALRGRRRDAIVITAGTAITVNLVLNRVFRGGVIMPGVGMSLAALHHFTAQLPKLDADFATPRRIDDTESAMRWGALLSGAGGIRLALEVLERGRGRTPRLVTGGDADRIARWLPATVVAPDLTLLGLASIARYNLSG